MTFLPELRQLSASLATLATVVLTAGVPVVHQADHADDHAHLEQAHGGHDHVVILEAGRVTTPCVGPTMVPTLAVVAWPSDVAPQAVPPPGAVIAHAGRDPPVVRPARGPPHRRS